MKTLKKVMTILFITLSVLAFAIYLFMQQAVFGKNPDGEDLARVKKSANYKNDTFENVEPTEVMLKDASMWKVLRSFIDKPANTVPDRILPSIKTNLKDLPSEVPTLVWFGHSSYLIQSKGYTILVDPVFSGHASPVKIFGKSFPGSDVYTVSDLPPIDLLIITHDHYDHLDYETIRDLHPSVNKIVTSLGVGSHLKEWTISSDKITELDWWEEKAIADSISITATPSRHFSGRGFQRGKTLWSSFVLNLHGYKLFVGGDSGFDSQFKKIGDQYGPFDLALLEAGQYGTYWPYIHMMPEETVTAAMHLRTKILLPVHWAKFALANHAWNEPIERLAKKAKEQGLPVTTPMIGQPVEIGKTYPDSVWWQ